MHRDHIRIIDFYLLFPFRIEGVRLTPQHRKYRKLAEQYADYKPYGDQPEDDVLFRRMEPMHIAAFKTLASSGFISANSLNDGQIEVTRAPLWEDLKNKVEIANKKDESLMAFLKALATDYNLLGKDGLKSRTGLLEYRYDPV